MAASPADQPAQVAPASLVLDQQRQVGVVRQRQLRAEEGFALGIDELAFEACGRGHGGRGRRWHWRRCVDLCDKGLAEIETGRAPLLLTVEMVTFASGP